MRGRRSKNKIGERGERREEQIKEGETMPREGEEEQNQERGKTERGRMRNKAVYTAASVT